MSQVINEQPLVPGDGEKHHNMAVIIGHRSTRVLSLKSQLLAPPWPEKCDSTSPFVTFRFAS